MPETKGNLLGFSFTGGKELKRKIAPKAIDRFKERIREITQKGRGRSMEQVREELARYLRDGRGSDLLMSRKLDEPEWAGGRRRGARTPACETSLRTPDLVKLS